MSETELEKKLSQVSKEIRAHRKDQPDIPLLSTKQEPTNMAKKEKTSKKSSKATAENDAGKAAGVDTGYSATQLASELGVDPIVLRKALRDTEAKKPGGRWVWPSKKDPALATVRADLQAHFKEQAGTTSKKSKGEEATTSKKKGKAGKEDPTVKAKKSLRKKVKAAVEGDTE